MSAPDAGGNPAITRTDFAGYAAPDPAEVICANALVAAYKMAATAAIKINLFSTTTCPPPAQSNQDAGCRRPPRAAWACRVPPPPPTST
jgi:hypothetical protein